MIDYVFLGFRGAKLNSEILRYFLFGFMWLHHQSLHSSVRGKELELEQAAEAYRNLQWLKQQSEEKERNTLREKDNIISQLQAALQKRSQETQVTHTPTLCCAISKTL